MSLKLVATLLSIAGIAGVAIGYYLRLIISLGKKGSMELEIKEMLLSAKEEAKKITLDAEAKSQKVLESTRNEIREKEEKIQQSETRLNKKEDILDLRQADIDKEVEILKTKATEIRMIKERADKLEEEKLKALEKVARLSTEDARQELLKTVEKNHGEDLLVRIQKLEQEGEATLEKKAQAILSTSIQRLANSVASDVMSTSVTIPNEEIKGKIIGKEGRNIKAFERMSGVEVIVDDTPGTIIISSFDPVRRHVAKQALEELIKDGRIQPAKIEKAIEQAQEGINKTIKEPASQTMSKIE